MMTALHLKWKLNGCCMCGPCRRSTLGACSWCISGGMVVLASSNQLWFKTCNPVTLTVSIDRRQSNEVQMDMQVSFKTSRKPSVALQCELMTEVDDLTRQQMKSYTTYFIPLVAAVSAIERGINCNADEASVYR